MASRPVSVILSTYNQPAWLEKCLLGYACQSRGGFEIVVADDGSTGETRTCIDSLRDRTGLSIRHVRHEDNGFRKTVILNRAIAESEGDYLIFSDGDCIPRADFVETHVREAERGRFLSGGYCKLPMRTSERITEDDIRSGRFSRPGWLRLHGPLRSSSWWKLSAQGRAARMLNALTTTRATWNGHGSSGWKSDILRVNGFDERMAYGGEDREIGERLENLGVRGKQVRYLAVCLHLDHARPWRNERALSRNAAIRHRTRTERLTWTEHGIERRPARAAWSAGPRLADSLVAD